MENRQDIVTIEQAYQEQLKLLYSVLAGTEVAKEDIRRFSVGVERARLAREAAIKMVSLS